MGRRIRFFDACAAGVMCQIGRGVIDYPRIRQLLQDMAYQGYITVEQERDPAHEARHRQVTGAWACRGGDGKGSRAA